jgi:hypothetical protein
MTAKLNELDVLKKYLPLKDNLSKYLCVRTFTKCHEDFEFRLASNLDTIINKFSHSGWKEMKPLIVGIKCYTTDNDPAFVYVRHQNRDKTKFVILDSFDAANEEWHTFKYPLLANYHTETYILMSMNISAYTLAIMDTSLRVRYDHGINEFPSSMYESFDYNVYGSFNNAIVYQDEKGGLIDMCDETIKISKILLPIITS